MNGRRQRRPCSYRRRCRVTRFRRVRLSDNQWPILIKEVAVCLRSLFATLNVSRSRQDGMTSSGESGDDRQSDPSRRACYDDHTRMGCVYYHASLTSSS